jgi:hypothetical protein
MIGKDMATETKRLNASALTGEEESRFDEVVAWLKELIAGIVEGHLGWSQTLFALPNDELASRKDIELRYAG